MKFILSLLSASLVIPGSFGSNDSEFLEFAARHNKSYVNQADYNQRKSNWNGARFVISSLNSSGGLAYFEVNYTADFSDAEYKNMLGFSDPEAGERLLEDLDFDHAANER